MSNPATKAPNFTRENAGEMARRATASRLARIAREKSAKESADAAMRAAAPKPDDARRKETLKQLDALDGLIDAALAAGEVAKFLKLSAAKERLWKLVQTVPGHQRKGRVRAEVPEAPTPTPTAPQATATPT